MKIKDNFVTDNVQGTKMMVATGANSFSGLVRANTTAGFILDLLTENVTEEQIVSALAEKYDAPRGQIAEDVKRVLTQLRSIDALDE